MSLAAVAKRPSLHPPYQALTMTARVNTAGNLVLDSEDVRQFAVIFTGPQWEVVAHANQLSVDAQLLAREQDRTFENVFGVKLLSNIVHTLRLAASRVDGGEN